MIRDFITRSIDALIIIGLILMIVAIVAYAAPAMAEGNADSELSAAARYAIADVLNELGYHADESEPVRFHGQKNGKRILKALRSGKRNRACSIVWNLTHETREAFPDLTGPDYGMGHALDVLLILVCSAELG